MKKTLAYYVTLLRKDFANYCNEQLQALELTQGLLYFILYVGRHPGCAPKELAQALRMDTGHVTRSLAKLEQGGFLCQTCDARDRRARVLTLQAKGEHAFQVSHELFIRWDEAMLREVSACDRIHLLALLEHLVQMKGDDDYVRNHI